MTTQFTGGSTSNLDALSVAGTTTLAATTISGTTTFGTAPMATPSGSAPVYGCRAWCVFDGTLTGTNAPTAGGNVTSVTRNAAGDYTINFTTAMPDANYSIVGYCNLDGRSEPLTVCGQAEANRLAASIRINTRYVNSVATNGTNADMKYVSVAIFR